MGHNPSRWKIRNFEREQSVQQRAAELAECAPIIAAWNAHAAKYARPRFYPTIRAAIAAGTPWLQHLCPGCQQIADVDIRTIDRHPDAPLSALIPALSCTRCCDNPPFARLLSLNKFRMQI